MRYALISDIHGNLQALESVLKDIDTRGIDEIFCLGDIVGYGASPRECIKIIQERNIKSVMGNHDYAILNPDNDLGFTPLASEALDWTRIQLNQEDINFLRQMPLIFEREEVILAHSGIIDPQDFAYLKYDATEGLSIFTRALIIENFSKLGDGQRLFIGHTHVPETMGNNGEEDFTYFSAEQFRTYKKTICNVGSVGQPRDGDKRASYLLYDGKNIEYIRVEYDIETAAEKIIEAGLPKNLAKRLRKGN